MLLPYEIKDDPAYPQGGVAAVVVPAAAGRAGGAVEVLIMQDDPERPFLGPAGWQPVEYRWRSGPVRAEGSDLIVPLGERVTAQIDDYTPLHISLPALNLAGQAVWQGVTPPSPSACPTAEAGGSSGSSFIREPVIQKTPVEPPPPPTPFPEPEPEPEPQPEPEPEPDPKPEPELRPPPDFRPPEPERVPIADEPRGDPSSQSPSVWRRWAPHLAGGTLLVLFALAGLAWHASTPTVDERSRAEDRRDNTAVPPPPDPPARRHERALAALAAGDPNSAWAYFNQLEADGHGPSLLYLAQAADSVDFAPGLYTQPNDLAAIQLYARACVGGQGPAALAALQRLETTLRARADEGDSSAALYLRMQLPNAMATCR